MKKVWSYFSNKYFLCATVLMVHLFVTVDTNVFQLFKTKSEIGNQQAKNDHMRSEIERISNATKELTTNMEAKEKYAREAYFMKKDNEDIFVFIEE